MVVSSTPDIEQDSLGVSRSSTIALNMNRKVPYPVLQEVLTACCDVSDVSCFVPSQSTSDLCVNPLSAGRRHHGKGPDDVLPPDSLDFQCSQNSSESVYK